MKLKSIALAILISIYGASPAVLATKPVTQLQEAQTTAEMYTLAETIKVVENQLVNKLIDERANKTLHKATQKAVRKMMDKALTASHHLSQTEKAQVLKRLANSSKQSLKKLSQLSSNRWQAYVGVLNNTKAVGQLKKIIASSADEVSTTVLKQMNAVDQLIKQGKQVSKTQLKALMDGVKALPPEQAKAGYDLIAKKLGSEWKTITEGGSATASFVGTVVDGVFVLMMPIVFITIMIQLKKSLFKPVARSLNTAQVQVLWSQWVQPKGRGLQL